MRTPTEPLRQEHRHIRPRLTAIRALADRIEEIPADALSSELRATVAFLDAGLIPHALAEDQFLYPAVAELMGTEDATATMSRDHLEIARLAEQLRHLSLRFRQQPTRRLRRDLRRVLYRLEVIVGLHLDKEEEIYLPLLDARLTEAQVAEIFQSMNGGPHGRRRVS
jgi:iron-sulfur cluster repair protein YtfE (RIC family)